MSWNVIETACYPCAYKVVSDRFKNDNSPRHYFPEQGLAQKEADRRNKRLEGKL